MSSISSIMMKKINAIEGSEEKNSNLKGTSQNLYTAGH